MPVRSVSKHPTSSSDNVRYPLFSVRLLQTPNNGTTNGYQTPVCRCSINIPLSQAGRPRLAEMCIYTDDPWERASSFGVPEIELPRRL